MINLFRPVYDAVYQPRILYNSTNYLWPACVISVTISDISDDDNSSAKKQNWKSAKNQWGNNSKTENSLYKWD